MTYHILRFFLKLISYIPFGVLYLLSDGMYFLLYYVARYRRGVVRRNLVESFPDKSKHEIIKIEKQFYHFFMDMILESCKLASISPEEMKRRMKFPNVEEINAVSRQGTSVALYLGHYGNWEWVSTMPLWLNKGTIGAQIYHKLRNPHMERLMLELRQRMGAVCVDMRKTARFVTELSRQGSKSYIGFIADQSPKKDESRHFLPFLHHKTPVLTGTEKIIKHYGFEAWFVDVVRVKRGYYEARFVRMHDDPQSVPDYELTALYFKHLEQNIIRQPELYLWTHNRFKHAELLDE